MARGLILEYDHDGIPVGVVLTRSALEKLKDFLSPNNTNAIEKSLKKRAVSEGD